MLMPRTAPYYAVSRLRVLPALHPGQEFRLGIRNFHWRNSDLGSGLLLLAQLKILIFENPKSNASEAPRGPPAAFSTERNFRHPRYVLTRVYPAVAAGCLESLLPDLTSVGAVGVHQPFRSFQNELKGACSGWRAINVQRVFRSLIRFLGITCCSGPPSLSL